MVRAAHHVDLAAEIGLKLCGAQPIERIVEIIRLPIILNETRVANPVVKYHASLMPVVSDGRPWRSISVKVELRISATVELRASDAVSLCAQNSSQNITDLPCFCRIPYIRD